MLGLVIEDAVRFINLTAAKMLVDYALKIGNYLLTRFFNDDIGLATSKNPFKSSSFSQLCKRPDIALTRQTMSEMVRTAAQVPAFRSIGVDISRLHYTHQLYELASESRTQLKQTAARWIADIEAKREEYQSLIDHLDYIATHPNY